MKLEDYSKYYIQGSDHYLIPKDVFIELFNEMQGWKDDFIGLRDVEQEHQKINGELREENKQLKLELLEKKCSDKDVEYQEKLKLQQRISKAIEYIEYIGMDDTFDRVILEILKGDSNE